MPEGFDYTPAAHYFDFRNRSASKSGYSCNNVQAPTNFTVPLLAAYNRWPLQSGAETHTDWLSRNHAAIADTCNRALDQYTGPICRNFHVQVTDLGVERTLLHPIILADLVDAIAEDLALKDGTPLRERVQMITFLGEPDELHVHWQPDGGY